MRLHSLAATVEISSLLFDRKQPARAVAVPAVRFRGGFGVTALESVRERVRVVQFDKFQMVSDRSAEGIAARRGNVTSPHISSRRKVRRTHRAAARDTRRRKDRSAVEERRVKDDSSPVARNAQTVLSAWRAGEGETDRWRTQQRR